MSGQIAIWLDGRRTSSLPLPDRGVDFGDGLFETILLHQGKPLFLEYHLERLAMGLRILRLPLECLDAARSQLETVAGVIEQTAPWAAMRLSIIRGTGPRGYAPQGNASPRILISVNGIDRDCAKMNDCAAVGIAEIRLSSQPALAQIKHLNRLEQILASVQMLTLGVDEGLMLDQAGHITSVIAGNFFMVKRGMLVTPRLVDCGVAGTRRRLIIEKWAPALGLIVQQSEISLKDLKDAEEVFYSNSLQTVRPVARVVDQHWASHNVCKALFECYLDELSA